MKSFPDVETHQINGTIGITYADYAAIKAKDNLRISDLEAAIEILKECLEFYASTRVWDCQERGMNHADVIDSDDCSKTTESKYMYGGKRARDILKQLELVGI